MLRTSTERPEAVDAGYAKVMGFDTGAICAEIEARAGKGRPSQEHPYLNRFGFPPYSPRSTSTDSFSRAL